MQECESTKPGSSLGDGPASTPQLLFPFHVEAVADLGLNYRCDSDVSELLADPVTNPPSEDTLQETLDDEQSTLAAYAKAWLEVNPNVIPDLIKDARLLKLSVTNFQVDHFEASAAPFIPLLELWNHDVSGNSSEEASTASSSGESDDTGVEATAIFHGTSPLCESDVIDLVSSDDEADTPDQSGDVETSDGQVATSSHETGVLFLPPCASVSEDSSNSSVYDGNDDETALTKSRSGPLDDTAIPTSHQPLGPLLLLPPVNVVYTPPAMSPTYPLPSKGSLGTINGKSLLRDCVGDKRKRVPESGQE